MKRVVLGNKLSPTCFLEESTFHAHEPYVIVVKRFENDDTAIPHCAPTAELIVSNGAEGSVQVESTSFSLSGKTVLYIPPGRVHSNLIKKGDGVLYVLKLSPEYLSPYLGVEKILKNHGSTLYCAPLRCELFDAIEKEILTLIENDGNEIACMRGLLCVLELLSPYMKMSTDTKPLITVNKNDHLKRLIEYTEKHLAEGISNRDAAAFVGYSCNYFCKWFRNMTGTTYNEYLMHLRITRACRLLDEGRSLRETAELLGYTNISFFLRKFKEHLNCTPGEYRKNASSGSIKKETDVCRSNQAETPKQKGEL